MAYTAGKLLSLKGFSKNTLLVFKAAFNSFSKQLSTSFQRLINSFLLPPQ
jgi:hypothetical protein